MKEKANNMDTFQKRKRMFVYGDFRTNSELNHVPAMAKSPMDTFNNVGKRNFETLLDGSTVERTRDTNCNKISAKQKGPTPSSSPKNKRSKAASNIQKLSIPECVIQLPSTVKANNCILVTWPGPDKISSLVKVPQNFTRDPTETKPLFVRVKPPPASALRPKSPPDAALKAESLPDSAVNTKHPHDVTLMEKPPPRAKAPVKEKSSGKGDKGSISTMNSISPVKEKNEPAHKCSRVGESYQASQIPDSTHWQRSAIGKTNTQLFDEVWDPVKAENSDEDSKTIYSILENMPTNKKELMMEALHKSDYDTKKAWESFLQNVTQLTAIGKMHGDPLYEGETRVVGKAVMDHRKNFEEVMYKLRKAGSKISLCTLLVHYYRNIKVSPQYVQLKKDMETETDECYVCHNGGFLICCDHCGQAYHMDCLKPPLRSVPKGNWFCPICVRKGKKTPK